MALKRDSRVFKYFKHVLIATNVEVHGSRDQASIAQFAPEIVTVVTSGAEAVDYLADNTVDLVLCDSSLDDMAGTRFVSIVSKNMNLKMLPVVMITLENTRKHVLDAISAGCVGYVLRPYSMETLEKYLLTAQHLDRYPEIEDTQMEEAREMVSQGQFDEAIEVFEEIVSLQDEAQRYYDMGYDYLLQSLYGKAIVAFKKAVRINDLFAEAYKGLADAYKGKGDMNAYKANMQKAAEVHAQFDRMEEAKSAFIEVLQHYPDVPNPYNSLGVSLRKQGDYKGAVHAYKRALELTPDDEHVHFNLGKAYYFMGETETAGKWLTASLSLNAGFVEAQRLYQRVFNKPWSASGDGGRMQDDDSPKSAMDV